MSSFRQIMREMPRRRRRIFFVVMLALIAGPALTIFLFVHASAPPPRPSAKAAEASGAGKIQAQSTAAYGAGMNLNSEYRNAEQKSEKARAKADQAHHKAYYPSDRLTLQMKGHSDSSSDFASSAANASASGKGEGSGGANDDSDSPMITAAECLVPDPKGGYRRGPDGNELVGTRLPDGQCIMKDGDVYDRHGKLLINRNVPSATPTGPAPATNAAAAERKRRQRINRLGAYLSKLAKQRAQLAKVSVHSSKTEKTNGSNTNSGGASSPSAPASHASNAPLHGFVPGDELVAVLDTAINSDSPSQVRFGIPYGPLAGGWFMGHVQLEHDRVVVKINYLSWRGHYAKVDAYAIDPATHLGSLAGNVNSHWVARLSAAFVYGITTAARNLVMNQGTTTTTTTGSVVTRPSSSTSDILKAGAGNAADVLSKPLQKYVTEPATVTVPRETVVGVMFAAPTKIRWLPAAAIKEAQNL